MKMTRRELFSYCAKVAGATLGTLVSAHPSFNEATFPLLLGAVKSPKDVVCAFQKAQSGSLFASYAVFFPVFIASHDENAPSLLHRAADKQLRSDATNAHRLEALPAVAASHVLALRPHEEDVEKKLAAEIVNALRDSRREVQEIVLQNLLSSISVDYNTKYIRVPIEILQEVDAVIERAKSTPKLIFPLCISVQYLLTLRSVLALMSSKFNYALNHIDKTLSKLQSISTQKLPEYFWFANRLIELWRRLPKPNLCVPTPLVPQQSEALMAWDKLSYLFDKSILEHFALIRAFNLYNTVSTVEGSDTSYPQVISPDAAKVSLRKGVTFEITYNINTCLDRFLAHNPSLPNIGTMKGFQAFLQREYWESLHNTVLPEEYLSSISTQRLLADRVPFQSRDERILLWELWRETKYDFKYFVKILMGFGAGGAAGQIAYDTFYPLLQRFMGVDYSQNQINNEKAILPDAKAIVNEAANEAEKAVIAECGPQLDKMDSNLGAISIEQDGSIKSED
jgi:hypothetical protein